MLITCQSTTHFEIFNNYQLSCSWKSLSHLLNVLNFIEFWTNADATHWRVYAALGCGGVGWEVTYTPGLIHSHIIISCNVTYLVLSNSYSWSSIWFHIVDVGIFYYPGSKLSIASIELESRMQGYQIPSVITLDVSQRLAPGHRIPVSQLWIMCIIIYMVNLAAFSLIPTPFLKLFYCDIIFCTYMFKRNRLIGPCAMLLIYISYPTQKLRKVCVS